MSVKRQLLPDASSLFNLHDILWIRLEVPIGMQEIYHRIELTES